ncbi:hypothetical protein LCGC14_3119110 [marine sediment metagenome]|uniref:Uncharacterized protein n=1 Tax=marine sediment metagenome TaxID=412755 RepID=A0A0F8YAA9_9ZZZZ
MFSEFLPYPADTYTPDSLCTQGMVIHRKCRVARYPTSDYGARLQQIATALEDIVDKLPGDTT